MAGTKYLTVEEVLAAIDRYREEGKKIDEELASALRLFGVNEKAIQENNWPEIEGGLNEQLEKTFQSKSFNAQELKELNKEYEKYLERGIDAEGARKKIVEKYSAKEELLKAFKRQQELYLEAIKNGASQERGKKMATEAVIGEKESKIRGEEIVEEESRLFRGEKIKSKGAAAELIRDIQAEIEVEMIRDKVAENVIQELNKISENKLSLDEITKIREITEERFDGAIKGGTGSIDVVDRKEESGGYASAVLRAADALQEHQSQGEMFLKTVNKGVEDLVKNEPGLINRVRARELEERVAKIAGTDYAKLIREVSYPEIAGKVGGIEEMAAGILEESGLTPGETKENYRKAEVIKNLIRSPIGVGENIEKFENLRRGISGDTSQIPGARVAEEVFSVLAKNPKLAQSLEFMQGVIKFRQAFEQTTGGGMYQIGLLMKNETLKRFGLQLANRFGGEQMAAMASQLAAQGTEKGLWNILGGLFAGKIPMAAAGAAGSGAAASGTAAVAVGAAVPGPGWVVAIVTFLGSLLGDQLKKRWGGIKKGLADWLEKIGISLPNVKGFLQDLLGKTGGAVASGAIGIGGAVASAGALIASISLTTIIGPIVIGVMIVLVVYQTFWVTPLVSTMVPPKAGMGGGNCVLKTVAESEGMINCDQNAPEVNVPGISKANFVRVANAWKPGKNYAEECFNDVVARAQCAGVDPAFALWVWVHESGASNYAIPDVKDFGIAGQPTAPAKNFSKQIDYFLSLNFKNPCSGLSYWLGWATNFATGTCDINKPIEGSPGQNGQTYSAALEEQYQWIKPGGKLPSQVKTGNGSGNCAKESTEDQPTTTYQDAQGNEWICYGARDNANAVVPNFEPWDPSTPVPEGCPNRLPTTSKNFSQGPFASNCSHANMSSPAVDIAVGNGTAIYATHDGVAQLNADSVYGYYIDVHGKCNGVDFLTRYAHMPAGGYRVGNKVEVKAGQQIGIVDNTGSSTGPHLHYHITGLDKNKFGQYLGLTMEEMKKLWGWCQ